MEVKFSYKVVGRVLFIGISILLGGRFHPRMELADAANIFRGHKSSFIQMEKMKDSLFHRFPGCPEFRFTRTAKLFQQSCDGPDTVDDLPPQLLTVNEEDVVRSFMCGSDLRDIIFIKSSTRYLFDGFGSPCIINGDSLLVFRGGIKLGDHYYLVPDSL